MAMTNYAVTEIGKNTIDWDNGSDTYKLLLLTNAYTSSNTKQSVDFLNDIEGFEASFTGYVRKDVTGRTTELDNTNNLTLFKTSATFSWTVTGTATFRYVAIYKDVVGASTVKPVITIKDYGTDTGVTNDVLTVSFPSNVVFNFGNTN